MSMQSLLVEHMARERQDALYLDSIYTQSFKRTPSGSETPALTVRVASWFKSIAERKTLFPTVAER